MTLSRPTVSTDKRKRAVQSMKLSNVNWDEVAKQEGIDISEFHKSATSHSSVRSTATTLTNMSISEEHENDDEEGTDSKTQENAIASEESV